MTAQKDQKESVVDQMADDDATTEYPVGTPEFTSYLELRPRSRRGDFKRLFVSFQASQQKLSASKDAGLFDASDELTPEQMASRMEAAADADDMFDVMERLLGMCAVDPAAYEAWSISADNDVLSTVFAVFMKRSQPGEASSSTS